MIIKTLAMVFLLAATGYPYDSPQVNELITYTDADLGFTFNYPDYWVLVEDVETMLEVQDGSIDLIREEELTDTELSGYKVMVHLDDTHDYISNTAVLVYPHNPGGRNEYETSEEAVQSVKRDFEASRASGTYFLEETYIGNSHAIVYRRDVQQDNWRDEIRITYYIMASRTHAYMLVETILMSDLTDVRRDHFNQVIQSFRIAANESGAVDPSLDWGLFKPGEWTESETDLGGVGELEIREDFDNNGLNWPVGEDSVLENGQYYLDSIEGYPFTVRNLGLGQISFDFSYDGVVTFHEGDQSAGYGLVFGYRDDDNYFAFLITRGGQFIVIEESGGRVEHIVPWTSVEQFTGNTHWLLVQGDYQTAMDPGITHRYEMIFHVDGEPVGYVRIDRVLEVNGNYGVFVSEGLSVSFDWLESRNYVLDAIFSLERFE